MEYPEEHLSRRLAEHNTTVLEANPPNINRWLAASALQKAIRRGNEGEALRCTRLLVDVDPQRLWRRIAGIAMEDVGVADIDAVADAILASRSKSWRDKNGGDWKAVSFVVASLAAAPKSRDTDDLAAVACRHPDYDEARAELACAPQNALCEAVADRARPLAVRSLAAWYVAGTDEYTAPDLPRRRGDLRLLIDVYRRLGVPEYVVELIDSGAKKERGALPVNCGLLWLQASASPERHVRDERATLTHLGDVNGVSSEAYGVHTRTGKRAFAYFLKACEPMRDFLSQFIPDGEMFGVVAGLVWHGESGLLDRRLVFPWSDEILEMAKVADIARGSFPAERIPEALDLMRRHLPDLHRARLRVVEP